MLALLKSKNVNVVFVTALCTGELQPLDALTEGTLLENIDVNLKTSAIKPIHARWIVQGHTVLSESVNKLKAAWTTTGIKAMLQDPQTLSEAVQTMKLAVAASSQAGPETPNVSPSILAFQISSH